MFQLNGKPVTLDFLQGKAKEYNMNFDSYINTMKSKGLKEIGPGKTTPPKEDNQGAPAEVNVAPESPVGVSVLEDTSLDLQNPKTRKELGFNYGEEQKYLRDALGS